MKLESKYINLTEQRILGISKRRWNIRNEFFKKSIVILLVFAFVIVGCIKQYNAQESRTLLEERIEKFYLDLDPKIIWRLYSKELKRSLENNEKEFIEYFEKNNPFKEFKKFHFYIKDIEIDRYKAKVTMRFTAEEIKTGEELDTVLYDYWIFEDNNWYMNDPNRTQ